MAWKEPKITEMELTPEIDAQIRKSIYYNREGHLSDYSMQSRIEYGVFTFFISLIVTAILRFIVGSLDIPPSILSGITVFIFTLITSLSFYALYIWGFKSFHEAWYHFDTLDEIFTVTQLDNNGEWEVFEVPYESVDSLEWVDGLQGHAIIKAAGFEFHTSRSNSKRASSVTEMWDDLARMQSPMRSWPYTLSCSVCKRKFGNHTGTAKCPFDNVMLMDPDIKGRIDPEHVHPDDFDRL